MPHGWQTTCFVLAAVAAGVGVIKSRGQDTTSWWLMFVALAMWK